MVRQVDRVVRVDDRVPVEAPGDALRLSLALLHVLPVIRLEVASVQLAHARDPSVGIDELLTEVVRRDAGIEDRECIDVRIQDS